MTRKTTTPKAVKSGTPAALANAGATAARNVAAEVKVTLVHSEGYDLAPNAASQAASEQRLPEIIDAAMTAYDKKPDRPLPEKYQLYAVTLHCLNYALDMKSFTKDTARVGRCEQFIVGKAKVHPGAVTGWVLPGPLVAVLDRLLPDLRAQKKRV